MAAPSQQLNFRQIDSKLPRAAAAVEPFAFHYSTKNAKRPNRAQCRARIETYWSLRCKEVKMCDFLVRSIFANNTRASSRKEARATVESRAEAKEEKKTGRRSNGPPRTIEERGPLLSLTLAAAHLFSLLPRLEWESIILEMRVEEERRTSFSFARCQYTRDAKKSDNKSSVRRLKPFCLCDRTTLL